MKSHEEPSSISEETKPRTSKDFPTEVLRSAILEALKYAGLKESQYKTIEQYVDDDPQHWCSCCGSYCDPCELTIKLATQKARAILGLPAWPKS